MTKYTTLFVEDDERVRHIEKEKNGPSAIESEEISRCSSGQWDNVHLAVPQWESGRESQRDPYQTEFVALKLRLQCSSTWHVAAGVNDLPT